MWIFLVIPLVVVSGDEIDAASKYMSSTDFEKLEFAMNHTFDGLRRASTFFLTCPPEFDLGVDEFMSSLVTIAEELASEKGGTPGASFRETCKSRLNISDDHHELLETYSSTRNPNVLARLVEIAADEVSFAAFASFPRTVAPEVVKYMDAIVDSIDALSQGLPVHGRYGVFGDRVDAVKKGDSISPSSPGDLVKATDDDVCWRNFRRRLRRRPDVCREGYEYDGERFCYRRERQLRTVDATAQPKRRSGRQREKATCNGSSEYRNKRGNWCYAGCPSGYSLRESGWECEARCPSSFPASTPLMCGADRSKVAKAVFDISIVTLESGLTIGENIAQMTSGGATASGIIGSVVGFLEVSSSLVFPSCPVDAGRLLEDIV